MSEAILYAAMRFLKYWLPVIVWAGVILSASNDRFSSANSQSWLERLLGRDVPEIANIAVRKAGHLAAYGLLGALAARADRRMVVALGIAFVVAVIDETNQAMTITRSGSPWDVLLDLFGAGLAITGFLAVSGRSS